jgi:chemotaxis protein methyltransferase CheR
MTARAECTVFLQWALPRLGMRWSGFRKVRGQVCKRVGRRIRALGLAGFPAYREHLEAHVDEWGVLDPLCRVSISRFYRDRGVFDWLANHASPKTAWSAGCASGEEAYTLALLFPDCEILATDADPDLLLRARAGRYAPSSLKDLPTELRARAFDGDVIGAAPRKRITWHCEDVRAALPDRVFDLILCRYLVFTYFDETLQRRILDGLVERLAPGGLLVVGTHEALPPSKLAPVAPCIYKLGAP